MNILDLPIKPGIIEYYYMCSMDYLVKTIKEFDNYLSPDIKAIENLEDRAEAFCEFLDKHISNLDTVIEYYNLYDACLDEVLILKVDDEIIGIPFTYSLYNGIDVNEEKLGSFPRYHETIETIYKRD